MSAVSGILLQNTKRARVAAELPQELISRPAAIAEDSTRCVVRFLAHINHSCFGIA
jgi:hypothetical protein